MNTKLEKLAPVLMVEEVEPSLPIFVDRLGFEMTVNVPGGDGRLEFAILAKDGVEIMLQTHASVADDVPEFHEAAVASTQFLFVEVASIDAAEAAMSGVEPVLPRRTTFYNATEIGYREPGGHIIVLAEMGKPETA